MPPSIQFTAPSKSKPRSFSIYARPPKKQKMSLTQTYSLAHSARGKLSREAARADHDLRLLVGHANLLDSVMLDLANAEREQGQWFSKTILESEEAVEDPEEDWQAEDAQDPSSDSSSDTESDSESDSDSEAESAEFEKSTRPSRPQPNVTILEVEDEGQAGTQIVLDDDEDDEDDEDDDEENYGDLALRRTASRHECPPELSPGSESDSEYEDMPPSPPSDTTDTFVNSKRQSIADSPKTAALLESEQKEFIDEGYFLASRTQPSPHLSPTIITAF